MAGDWIKVQTCTPDKPEVHQMAEALGLDPDAVMGKLIRVWVWADTHTVDGNARSVTRSLLDRISGVTGFADALESAGWLESMSEGVHFTNFDRHNGDTAKTRALTGKRVAKTRSRNDSVTDVKRDCNAVTVTKTLPEKRREEKSNDIYQAIDIVIPLKMQTQEVMQYFRTWMSHLDLNYPDKVPPSNSPQLQMFWQEASRMGPEKFCSAVEYSVGRNWANLHQKDGRQNDKQAGYVAGDKISSVEKQRRSMEAIASRLSGKAERAGDIQADA